MRYDKPSLSIEQQVDLLQERGMQFSNPRKAAEFLFHHSYYRLRGYWIPLEVKNSPEHAFMEGSSFEQVMHLYEFDRKLRLLVFDAVERLEISFRTAWTYHFSRGFGSHAYLNEQLFRNRFYHKKNLEYLLEDVNKSKEPFIVHYKNTYTTPPEPPIWSVSELMSLGSLSKWYENLGPAKTKKEIASRYGLNEPVFESTLKHLTYIRNICAHHSRLWNRTVVITMKIPKVAKPHLLNGLNPDTPNFLYNTLVMLAYLIEIVEPGNHWKQRLATLITEYKPNLRSMGFPDDYTSRDIWS